MTSTQIGVPEPNKKRGVCYAVNDDGVELPVVDVTSPEFALKIDDESLAELVSKFIRDEQRSAKIPIFLRRLMYRFFLRRSELARGLIGAHDANSFLSGMSTYLLKLGPDNLSSAFTTPVDRRIAAALPALGVRLRLEDMASLIADGVTAELSDRPSAPLELVNIGGGAALDSLNALILLTKRHPQLIKHREIVVRVLDLDSVGPSFGAKALAALQREGAPLWSIDVTFLHQLYDWTDPNRLASLLNAPAGAVVAISSEGALFEYGSDEVIVANLCSLARHNPLPAIVAGSVTRADGAAPYLASFLRLPTRPRSLESFATLAHAGGFKIRHSRDRPFGHNISLEPLSYARARPALGYRP